MEREREREGEKERERERERGRETERETERDSERLCCSQMLCLYMNKPYLPPGFATEMVPVTRIVS